MRSKIYKAGARAIVPLLLLCCFTSIAQIAIVNKSFEGKASAPGAASLGWVACYATPDIQPGLFCVSLNPSDGLNYAGLGSQMFNGAERIGQVLTSPLQKNKHYRLFIDLSISNSPIPHCGGFVPLPLNFELWAGNCSCCRSKLLAKVDTIKHVGWKTYTLTFSPDSNYSHILLQTRNFVLESSYLLIDNLSDFEELKPTVDFTALPNDTVHGCTLQTLKGNTDRLPLAVEITSSLLDTTIAATLLTDTTWESGSFVYPLSCGYKNDTIVAKAYFAIGDTASNTLLLKIDCPYDTCGYVAPPDPILPQLYIPNLVTPNMDGKNDYFEITALPALHHLELYNRWGQRIFESSAYKNDWQTQDDGVYYYLLILENSQYKGWVQVVR